MHGIEIIVGPKKGKKHTHIQGHTNHVEVLQTGQLREAIQSYFQYYVYHDHDQIISLPHNTRNELSHIDLRLGVLLYI